MMIPSWYQNFDVLYVLDKFPLLDPDNATQLGKLITRGRRIFSYRKSHNEKLKRADRADIEPQSAATGPSTFLAKTYNHSLTPLPPSRDFFTSIARTGGLVLLCRTIRARWRVANVPCFTKASTFKLEGLRLDGNPASLQAPSIAESSYTAVSSFAGRDLRVQVPPRPKDKSGRNLDRFECP